MEINIDRIVGAPEDTKDFSKFEDSLVLINTPAVEKQLVYTEAKINDKYFKDISQIDDQAPLQIIMTSDGVKNIEYFEDRNGVKYPSVSFEEIQNLKDAVVVKLESGQYVRLLKIDNNGESVQLPTNVADAIIGTVTLIRSYWEKF